MGGFKCITNGRDLIKASNARLALLRGSVTKEHG